MPALLGVAQCTCHAPEVGERRDDARTVVGFAPQCQGLLVKYARGMI